MGPPKLETARKGAIDSPVHHRPESDISDPASAASQILRGHDKGILSVNFCPADSDLLLSSGKDGRSLAWSLTSGEIVAEVTPSSNWTFESHFVPSNPSMISAAALDGELYLHSLQSTNAPAHDAEAEAQQQAQLAANAATAGANDFFEQAISANAKNYPTKSLSVAPKWLRRPASVAFGFGGRLVRVAAGQGPRVQIDRIVTVPGVIERAEKLERAATGQEEGGLAKFCDDRAAGGEWEDEDQSLSAAEKEGWAQLKTLFHASAGGMPGSGGAEAREKLIEMLGGFDREDLKARVEHLVKDLRARLPAIPGISVDETASEVARSPSAETVTTTNKMSPGSQTDPSAPTDLTSTEPSLFGGSHNDEGSGGINGFLGGTDGRDQSTGDDFFASLGSGNSGSARPSALPDRLTQPSLQGQDASSSIAATMGSGPSSVKSLNLKAATFKLFQDGASEADRLVTQSLVLGDFASAVELALSTERYADALLFALQSASPDLVSNVQREYFARTATDRPYLRVLESISATSVGGGGRDLADVIQNADLEQNWREAFVVACTYAASDEEFSSLVEQLGQRLEYQYELVKGRAGPAAADGWRKNAVLCYLAAGKLEKVVGVWVQQMNEDEQARLGGAARDEATSATVRFEAHARALQAFVEKVQVFQHAVGYVDVELASPTQSTAVAESGARIYKLASLYDRYIEYAELLANQGKVDLALKYVAKTPADYDGTNSAVSANAMKRERLLRASHSAAATQGYASASSGYGSSSRAQAGRYAQSANAYGAPAAASNPYSNPLASSSTARTAYSNPYAPAPASTPAANANAYNPYAPAPAAAAAPAGVPSAVASPARNPYAPAQPMTNPHDDPYAPAPSAQGPPAAAAAAPPSAAASSNPYAPAPGAAGLTYAAAPSAAHDPYGPSAGGNPGAGLPAPPPMRTESPSFAGRNGAAAAAVPPPPRAKPASGWNDVPTLPAPRRNTPAPPSATGSSPAPGAPKPAAITSPFPNSSPVGTPGVYGAPPMGPGQVPPPPPSRGANRTPAPVPPPPMSGQAPPPPMAGRVLSPGPAANPQYAPPPPASMGREVSPGPAANSQYAPPPPRSLMGSLGPSQSPNGGAGPMPPMQGNPAPAPGQGAVVPPPPMAQRSGPTYAAPPPPRTGTPSAPPHPRASAAPPPPPPAAAAAAAPPPPPASNGVGMQQQQPGAPGSVPPPPLAGPIFAAPPPPPPASGQAAAARPPPPPMAPGPAPPQSGPPQPMGGSGSPLMQPQQAQPSFPGPPPPPPAQAQAQPGMPPPPPQQQGQQSRPPPPPQGQAQAPPQQAARPPPPPQAQPPRMKYRKYRIF